MPLDERRKNTKQSQFLATHLQSMGCDGPGGPPGIPARRDPQPSFRGARMCRHSWRHRVPSWRKLSACRVETHLDARGGSAVARICRSQVATYRVFCNFWPFSREILSPRDRIDAGGRPRKSGPWREPDEVVPVGLRGPQAHARGSVRLTRISRHDCGGRGERPARPPNKTPTSSPLPPPDRRQTWRWPRHLPADW